MEGIGAAIVAGIVGGATAFLYQAMKRQYQQVADKLDKLLGDGRHDSGYDDRGESALR